MNTDGVKLWEPLGDSMGRALAHRPDNLISIQEFSQGDKRKPTTGHCPLTSMWAYCMHTMYTKVFYTHTHTHRHRQTLYK